MRTIRGALDRAISLAPSLVVAVLTVAVLLFAQMRSAAADENRGVLEVKQAKPGSSTVVMSWRGKIAAPMAAQIREAFEAHKHRATRIAFVLDSGGGSVAEGESVIEVLRRIKGTHHLVTVVSQGQKCGSMCVFLYLQGHERVGALTSAWLFHEISRKDPETKRILLDRPRWEQLVDKYFRPAGVSDKWIDDMKQFTVGSDYWQTGADLVHANSGIIHRALGNQRSREITPARQPGRHGTPNEPAQARTAS